MQPTVEPLTFLALSQNIGSIDCSGIKNEIPEDIKSMTCRFLDSLRLFLKQAAKAKYEEYYTKSSPGAAAAASTHDRDALASSSSFASLRVSHNELRANHPSMGVSSSEMSDETSGGQTTMAKEPEIDVVVIHIQEIGGKKYNSLFNEYLASQIQNIWPEAGWCSGLLMQPQNCDCTFTAMGAILFLSRRVIPICSVLSVRHRSYVAVADDPLSYTGHSGCLFLGGKFSNAEKSRKGYLLTSLRIGSTCVNFVNLHLYHDADNATAAAESPSRYTPRRIEAFLEAMTEVVPVLNPDDPLFIFGDFNTRLDAKQALSYISRRLHFQDGDIKMGKKEVSAPDAFWEYFMSRENHRELHQFDREPGMLMDALASQSGIELCELPVHFPPTYMLDDSKHDGRYHDGDSAVPELGRKKLRPYKKERLPAWCDRLFLNAAALELITGVGPKKQDCIRKQNSGMRLKQSSDAASTATTAGGAAVVAEDNQNNSVSSGRKLVAQPKMLDDVDDDASCSYDSVSLECMDHEAVFLLF